MGKNYYYKSIKGDQAAQLWIKHLKITQTTTTDLVLTWDQQR